MKILRNCSVLFKNKPKIWCLSVASASLAYIAYQNRSTINKYFTLLWKYFNPNTLKIISTESEGKCVIEIINRKCSKVKVLGLDCEWVTKDGKQRPVALLQLATSDGFCSLFQLCHFDKIPQELYDLLANKDILKVGVAVFNDARFLMNSYGLKCDGFLDIRYLAQYLGEQPHGLAGLAKEHLGVILNKDWRLRCSDWEVETLSQEQISYAAHDAQVAVELFHKLNKKQLHRSFGILKCFFWHLSKETYWQNSLNLWKPFVNLNFKERGFSTSSVKRPNPKINVPHKKTYHTLSKRYYDNIFLQAPDGEVLCTISASRYYWYLKKELADVVSEDPMTIRLRFEPRSREVNGYYSQVKENICVVCGSDKSMRRKNIVPLEYRRHFPDSLKKYCSHDVLLLCLDCHTRSNIHDQALREKLGDMCNASLRNGSTAKVRELPELKSVRSAARALYFNNDTLPEVRQEELKKVIVEYLNIDVEQITKIVLEELIDMNCCVQKDDFISHGTKVVEHFESNPDLCLEMLERLWRQHFIDTMAPQHLPDLWSVDLKRYIVPR